MVLLYAIVVVALMAGLFLYTLSKPYIGSVPPFYAEHPQAWHWFQIRLLLTPFASATLLLLSPVVYVLYLERKEHGRSTTR
jgi:hypothetical protein